MSKSSAKAKSAAAAGEKTKTALAQSKKAAIAPKKRSSLATTLPKQPSTSAQPEQEPLNLLKPNEKVVVIHD